MQLTLKDDLPFLTVKVAYCGVEIEVPHVLVDTGSASTILAADVVAQTGIVPELGDCPAHDTRRWWNRGSVFAPG